MRVCITYVPIKLTYQSEISGSHGCQYKDDSVLGYSAVQSRRISLTFQMCVLPPSSERSVTPKHHSTYTRLHEVIPKRAVIFKYNIVLNPTKTTSRPTLILTLINQSHYRCLNRLTFKFFILSQLATKSKQGLKYLQI
jgi:hypothetical protein